MNPLGLHSAGVLAAHSGRTRHVKPRPIAWSERHYCIRAITLNSRLRGCFGYSKFTSIGLAKDMCVQCNMDFFSSSRKIFAPV
jgi:hypothetical protein